MYCRALFQLAVLSLATILVSSAASARPQSGVSPRTVTLQKAKVTVSEALALLREQTGIEVKDSRDPKENAELSLDLSRVTFWQALDAIARAANARVYLYADSGRVALVKGPWHEVPVSYSGPFRVSLTRLVAERNFETGTYLCKAALEVAWEPGARPFFLETQPRSLVIQDGDKHEVKAPESGGGPAAPESLLAMSVELSLPALPGKIALLKGSLSAIGPKGMLKFTFDRLDELEKNPKARQKSQQGVAVEVRKLFLKDQERWTVELGVRYPAGMPHFESFQSWVRDNEIHLEHVSTKQRFPNNGNLSENVAGNRAVISYHFIDEPKKGLFRGKPGEWRLIYEAPAAIVETPIAFEFKDLARP